MATFQLIEMVDPIPLASPHRSNIDFFYGPLDSYPLWFKPSLFLFPDFNSKAYISNLRTFVPFDTLRSELKSYHTSLNHDLIDHNYANFVNLTTNFVEFRENIEQFCGSVQGSLVALTNGLKQRSEVVEAREILKL